MVSFSNLCAASNKIIKKYFFVNKTRSGIGPTDLYSIYEYMISTVFPKSTEDDLRGGSLTRSQRSYSNCLDSHYGAYLLGPESFSDNCQNAPLVYIFNEGQCQTYYMIVYSALSAALCLFVEGNVTERKPFIYRNVQPIYFNSFCLDETTLTETFYDELHTFVGPQLTSIASDIGEQFTKENSNNKSLLCTTSSSSINAIGGDDSSQTIKYLFFNELNCQHNGTVHLNQKLFKKKNTIPRDIMNLLNDLYVQDANKLNSCEVIVKTLNDHWIVKRSSNWRHSFIVFNKSSTLLEIADEANKLFDQHLNDVFNRA